MISCNGDCFNCPYPDVPVECLTAPLTEQERASAVEEEIERIKQMPLTAKQRYQRIRYLTHGAEIRAQKKAHREANLEECRAYMREYQRNYRAENKAKYGKDQRHIARARKRRGWTQAGLAENIGVSESTVAIWETGRAKANWYLLSTVLPELKRYRPREEAL